MMAHGAAALLGTSAVWACLVGLRRRSLLLYLLAGVLLGALFWTRALDALLFALPAGLLLVWETFQAGRPLPRLPKREFSRHPRPSTAVPCKLTLSLRRYHFHVLILTGWDSALPARAGVVSFWASGAAAYDMAPAIAGRTYHQGTRPRRRG